MNNSLTLTKSAYRTLLLIMLLNLTFLYVNAQNYAMVINGGNIHVNGSSNPNLDQSAFIDGDFLNLSVGSSNGEIELNGGSIYLTRNWINDANNNVFTNFSGDNKDGFVTMNGGFTQQFIAGINPTHFENLIVESSRKILDVDSAKVNGVFTLNSPFELNGNNLRINNPNANAITYLSGFIKSETMPGSYGLVHWNIGSSTGLYEIPFGSDVNSFINNLNFRIEIKTPMMDDDYISFGTYPTDKFNYPLPTFGSNLEHDITKVVDRFWIIRTSNQINKPLVDLYFKITPEDILPAFNKIDPIELKAIRNNTDFSTWTDFGPSGFSTSAVVKVSDVDGSNLFEPWTLLQPPPPVADMYVPDAFTPDGDGINDVFKPVMHHDFEIIDYDLYIYNRWGEVVWHTNDVDKGWDGTHYEGSFEPKIGVYSWVIIVNGKSVEEINANGYTKKYVGRVTLYK